jgi:hypothetical protein
MKKRVCEANSKDYSMSFKLQLVQEIEGDIPLQKRQKKLWYSK